MNVRTIGVAVACLFALSGCASTPTMGWEIPPTPTEAWLVAAGPCANLVEPISRVENAYRDALAARISQEEFTRQLQIASEEIPAAELPEPVATALQAPLDSQRPGHTNDFRNCAKRVLGGIGASDRGLPCCRG